MENRNHLKKTGRQRKDKQEEKDDIYQGIVDIITTAVHEVGHSVVGRALLKDLQTNIGISVIPGVTVTGSMYKGMCTDAIQRDYNLTKEIVIKKAAQLLAGQEAVNLLVRGGYADAGASNDYIRATELIKTAILSYGLSEKWNYGYVPEDEIEIFINSLSDKRKQILEQEIAAWIKEARALARVILVVNLKKV